MTKTEILTIITGILGGYRQTGPENYAFFCPYCKHYKRKLEINIETFNYHCWTCQPKLGGKNFFFLFREFPNVLEGQLAKIKEYTNTQSYKKSETSKTILRIPKEFRSMQKSWPGIEYKHAAVYLKKRKITDLDIKKYNIGYCEDGEYGGRIIIPSYDSTGALNFFSSRTFFDHYLKYKNPKVSRDIVAFESLISWNSPIILCEGMLDAIALKRNAIPLLGKNLQSELKAKLELHKVKEIYICLDNDAKEAAVEIAQELQSQNTDRNVYVLKLNEKDPSEIGFEGITHILKDTPIFDFENLIYTRLFE